MPMPWLNVIDALMGAVDLVRWVKGRPLPAVTRGRETGSLEARMVGAAVSAVRDMFEGDRDRFELERQRIEADRERAERALRLELLRQAGEREISRLRGLTAIATASWLGGLLLAARAADGGVFVRVMIGLGLVLLLASLAASLSAQAHVGRALGRMNDRWSAAELTASPGGGAARWMLIAGLCAIAVSAVWGGR